MAKKWSSTYLNQEFDLKIKTTVIALYLKQHNVEVGSLCDLAPPSFSESNNTVVNEICRSVTIC